MKKKDKIYDSPEYKQIREHLPEILKEMERDKGLKQYQMPEGWNEDFERIYQAEHRKERIRNRILAGACAAIILGIGAVHVGERLELTSMVQADDIGTTTENGFEQDGYQYSLHSNIDESEQFSEDNDSLVFDNTTPSELYEEMKTKVAMPFFWIDKISTDFIVKEAEYSKLHRSLSYRLIKEESYIYVSQQMQIEETGNGFINEEKVEDTVWIEALEMNADIYRSPQDNSLNCTIVYKNNVVFLMSNMELDQLEEIISRIYFK